MHCRFELQKRDDKPLLTYCSICLVVLESSYHEFVTKQLMFKSCEAFRMHQRLRKLRHNALNNTLEMGDNICPQLQLVDLQDNQIAYVTVGSQYKNTLMMSVFPEQVLLCATLAYEMLLIPGCSKVCQLQINLLWKKILELFAIQAPIRDERVKETEAKHVAADVLD
ncbi:hypothetical protein KIW84_032862 [Lathyrus oleraceus]|uniref:Uncharacterized protein n=1 Tax=Pisum sativum TaxID=3888 RepID=A0A9D5B2B3_PEA|nr:hypothetical protein KIW84_032861 [Pisum sativum]KAI5427612.1 hypothetical protein KIW84_032862 [Pisum sativum]